MLERAGEVRHLDSVGAFSAMMKDRLATALASGDTQAIMNLAAPMGSKCGGYSPAKRKEAPAQPYRQAVSQ